MEKVIVLMSTYNGEKYIGEQIESILNQNECLVELLIRDDGSTDKTVEIIRQYTGLDNVTILEENENLRPAKSFLRLLEVSPKNKYYAFADQDDVWDNDKLITGIEMIGLDERPTLYCSNARVVDENLNSKGFNVYKNDKYVNFESLVINGNFMGCTMVFNNNLKDKIVNAPELDYYLMHDYFITIFCAMINGNVIYDKSPHMDYRIHNNNTVGVSTNCIEKLTKKIKYIVSNNQYEILKQCRGILQINEFATENNRSFMELLSEYDRNFKSKFKLIMNHQIKYENVTKRIEVMIKILKGTL